MSNQVTAIAAISKLKSYIIDSVNFKSNTKINTGYIVIIHVRVFPGLLYPPFPVLGGYIRPTAGRAISVHSRPSSAGTEPPHTGQHGPV